MCRLYYYFTNSCGFSFLLHHPGKLMTTVAELTAELREEFLTCSLCFTRFVKPKLLPCQHTFCARCVYKWFMARPVRGKHIQCPICRDVCQIPAAGVQHLPDNLMVVGLMDFLNSRIDLDDSVTSLPGGLIQQFGTKGNREGNLYKPKNIAVHPTTRELYIADSKNRVQVFDSDGKFVRKFQLKNWSKKLAPGGVVVTKHLSPDGQERLLISDMRTKQILVCDLLGQVVQKVGKHDVAMPGPLAVTSDGHIHVIDVYARVVRIYDEKGAPLRMIGRYGTSGGAFRYPRHIAVTSNDDLVVPDSTNHTVQVFDQSGKLKRAFGVRGKADGQFRSPTGLGVDDDGNILVADLGNHSLQLFDSTGKFLRRVDDYIDDLRHPEGMCMMSQNKVAVVDTRNHCIKVFSY